MVTERNLFNKSRMARTALTQPPGMGRENYTCTFSFKGLSRYRSMVAMAWGGGEQSRAELETAEGPINIMFVSFYVDLSVMILVFILLNVTCQWPVNALSYNIFTYCASALSQDYSIHVGSALSACYKHSPMHILCILPSPLNPLSIY